jgi:hypothetical protein
MWQGPEFTMKAAFFLLVLPLAVIAPARCDIRPQPNPGMHPGRRIGRPAHSVEPTEERPPGSSLGDDP